MLSFATGTTAFSSPIKVISFPYPFSESAVAHDVAKKEGKADIIAFSIKYSLVTEFTSFVAIEKRGDGEVQHCCLFVGLTRQEKVEKIPTITELVTAHSVDQLPYIDWQEHTSMTFLRQTVDARSPRNS